MLKEGIFLKKRLAEIFAKNTGKDLKQVEKDMDRDNWMSAEEAKEYAESEFEKYRIVQDKLFLSDFDKEIKGLFDKDAKK